MTMANLITTICNWKKYEVKTIIPHFKQEYENVDNTEYTSEEISLPKQSEPEEVKYKCTKCKDEFSSQGGLWLHRESKHDGEKYQCDHCDYTTSFKDILTSHSDSKHSDVTKHKQSQHDAVNYDCDQCGFKDTAKNSLNAHR